MYSFYTTYIISNIATRVYTTLYIAYTLFITTLYNGYISYLYILTWTCAVEHNHMAHLLCKDVEKNLSFLIFLFSTPLY
jgi:hypothetical protein